MEVKFNATYVNKDLEYALGVVGPRGSEEYVMRVTDSVHIIMTDRENWTPGSDPIAIFALTEEEYNWKDTDPEKLDDLAQKLRTEIPLDRLISEQNGVRKKDRAETIDYGKYTRYKKELIQQRQHAAAEKILTAEELYCMYCNETGKPYLLPSGAIQVFEDKTMAMETANELRKINLPLIVMNFKKDLYNKEESRSVFQELIVLGFPVMMFVDAEKRQTVLPLQLLIKHEAFLGQKNNVIYGNPKLDVSITHMFQFMRTPNMIDKSDPEKYKEIVRKRVLFMESRIVEALSDARFLVPTKDAPTGKISTPILKAQPQRPEMPKDAQEGAEETAAAQEPLPEKQFLPVFTNSLEFASENNKFKAAVLPYDKVLEIVRANKLDGIMINMHSRIALPCTEERFKQVEAYRAWKAEHQVNDPTKQPEETFGGEADEGAMPDDTPFVPIVNQNKQED
ncbi:MAG: SseB family protein [Clostridia bacterium]|nr:SseB family protein [Clostridia bacterium]